MCQEITKKSLISSYQKVILYPYINIEKPITLQILLLNTEVIQMCPLVMNQCSLIEKPPTRNEDFLVGFSYEV